MNLVNKVDMKGLLNRHNTGYYYKVFKTKSQLSTMIFVIQATYESPQLATRVLVRVCGVQAPFSLARFVSADSFSPTFSPNAHIAVHYVAF